MKFLPENLIIDGRELRQQQIDVLRWLDLIPRSSKVVGIIAPTGSGKSLISRAIQLTTGGSYLAPTNVLVNQYVNEFQATPIYGKSVYEIEEIEGHTKAELQQLASAYAFNRLEQGEGHFAFNPISFALHKKKLPKGYSQDMIADEAHRLVSLISLQATQTIQVHPKLPLPSRLSDLTIYEWLKHTSKLFFGPEKDKINAIIEVYNKEPEIMSYQVSNNRRSILFTPVIPPLHLLKRLFTSGQKFLLSATLPKRLIPHFVPGVMLKDINILELPSDFPVTNREIRYKPVYFREDSEIYWPKAVVPKIVELFQQHGSPNTLVHVPYAVAADIASSLARHLPGTNVYFYTNTTKQETINLWRENGGILIGCGIAEGVDFPGDICRLNIVPKIILSDLGAVAVQKRKALEGGEDLYYLSALIDLIQAFGRGVRSKDDWCNNYCLDPLFPKLITKYHTDLPQSFKEAIVMG